MEIIKTACLDDLTTAGTTVSGHTNRADWTGLNAAGTTNPSGVPGIQVNGYFPETSTGNKNNGWNHDSQFVLGRARRRRRARRWARGIPAGGWDAPGRLRGDRPRPAAPDAALCAQGIHRADRLDGEGDRTPGRG